MFIKVKVHPYSKDEGVMQIGEDKFDVKVREKPEMNLANDRARELLAQYFGLPEYKFRLVSGAHKQSKIFEIKDES